ncbi:MAG: hypothetical protein E6370_00025 [Clostridiales bacterium]|nr:hypothetical protein [Clostridiales bacterium]MDU6972691.1 hypothetical protein [Clostridiales bacterium]
MKTLKYCPQLNAFTGSITASLLMCQLEYWFNHTNGQAFYKFLEPCQDEHYHIGDSWIEEMGFTKTEFRTAFKHIGKIYKSKTEFLKSKDKFCGKLYLSYYDRIKKLTYYLRNNDEASSLLRNLEDVLPYSLDYTSSKDYALEPSKQTKTMLHKPETVHTSPLPEPNYPHILHLFHTNCPSLSQVSYLSHKCQKLLASLCDQIREKGLDLFTTLEQGFKMVEQSDFLCGRGKFHKWRAIFSWIIRPDKFFAILEGAYLPFQQPPAQASSSTPYVSPSAPSLTMQQPSSKPPHKFMRMYTHNFDIQELEANESAYLDAHYGPL